MATTKSQKKWRKQTNLKKIELYLSPIVIDSIDTAVKAGGYRGRAEFIATLIKEEPKPMNNVMVLNDVTMSSREIAEICEKRHANVIRDIDKAIVSDISTNSDMSRLFTNTNYMDEKGESRREVMCTKKGTLLLVTGYSIEHRMRLIDRWMELEEAKKPKTTAELLVVQAQLLVEHERRVAALEVEQKIIAERQRITEGKIEDFASGAEHFSITAYNKLYRHYSISNNEANSAGRTLTGIANNNGIELGRAPHPVWGTVNTYPKAMLDAFYKDEYH